MSAVFRRRKTYFGAIIDGFVVRQTFVTATPYNVQIMHLCHQPVPMCNMYRVSINDCRVQPAMETCQILNVPLCSANNECHIFRLGCWLLTRDKFQLCFTLANINVFIV
jgi:hypothetical protein